MSSIDLSGIVKYAYEMSPPATPAKEYIIIRIQLLTPALIKKVPVK